MECTQIIPIKEAIIPATTGQAAPLLLTIESTIPPNNAPLVSPTRLNAALITEVISRLRNATTTSIPPQNTVAQRLTRSPAASSFCFPAKPRSIVETEANALSAELTDDIAAAKMPTNSNPLMPTGASASMKIGNT